jgi:hypothetical protein
LNISTPPQRNFAGVFPLRHGSHRGTPLPIPPPHVIDRRIPDIEAIR